jgi:hypothetical protein
VFQWLYRVTFNWDSVIDLVSPMKSHLRLIGLMKDRHSRPSTNGTFSVHEDVDLDGDYSVLFREYFCVAAEELASSLGLPLWKLGVLYTGIMTTGSITSDIKRKRGSRDVEQGLHHPILFGNGQLLFVVRTADKNEASELTALGYRFAQAEYVTDIIARAMKVHHSEIVDIVGKLRNYSDPLPALTSGGTYLSAFAIRAMLKGSKRSWEILVPTEHPGELPSVELTAKPLNHLQISRLSKLDGLSVSQCLLYLNNITYDLHMGDEKDFVELLLDQITKLTELVPEDFFRHAVFSATPVAAPGLGDDRDSAPPLIYSFSVIPDVHGASIKNTTKVTYIPLNFFQCIQRVYKHSPDHSILSQRIHREFGTILSRKGVSDMHAKSSRLSYRKGPQSGKTGSGIASHLSIPSLRGSKTGSPTRSGTLSPNDRDASIDGTIATISSTIMSPKSADMGLEVPAPPTPRTLSPAFGGIMVSSDTKIEVSEGDGGEKSKSADFGVTAEASVVANEEPTYVDELFKITSRRFRNR